MQQIVGTVEEAYLSDIRNRTMNSINDTMAGVLTHLQDKYSQLMPHELLEREDIVKKTIYNQRDPIATVFSTVKKKYSSYLTSQGPHTHNFRKSKLPK